MTRHQTHVYSRDPVDSPEAAVIRAAGIDYISTQDVADPFDLEARLGRIDIMIEATGAAAVAAEAMALVQPNGILCLLSITGASEPLLVLGNGVVFGSVNSSRPHFERAIDDLEAFEERWPGLTSRLITRRVPLARYQEAFTSRKGDIKVLIELDA